MLNAVDAGREVGSLVTALATKAARRTSSNMSRSLLEAAPSVPTVAARDALAIAAPPTTWSTARSGTLAGQLIANIPAYTRRGPGARFGWNGPYLTTLLGPDPWNNRYMVNVAFLDANQANASLKRAVWVISAGPDGIVQTSFNQPATHAAIAGDDVGFRIQ